MKIFFQHNTLEGLAKVAIGSRAQRGHQKSRDFRGHRLGTAESYGFIDFTSAGGAASVHFLEFLEPAKTLWESLHQAPEDHTPLVELAFANLASLHRKGLIHGDLKLNNIMLQGNDFYFIDLDGARESTKLRARAKDVARLVTGLSEVDVRAETTQAPFVSYCKQLDLEAEQILPLIRRFARRTQDKHLAKYQREAKDIL